MTRSNAPSSDDTEASPAVSQIDACWQWIFLLMHCVWCAGYWLWSIIALPAGLHFLMQKEKWPALVVHAYALSMHAPAL